MQASVPMVIAFAKAAEYDTLDHVTWQEAGINFSACLKDDTQANFTYDLYEETLLVGTFTIDAPSGCVNYDCFLSLPFNFAPAPFNEVPMYNDCPSCGTASPFVTQSIQKDGSRKRRWKCPFCGLQFITTATNWEDDVSV